MTRTGDPLPGEDEADRLFREVAPLRSTEPEPPKARIGDELADVAAAARDTAARAVAAPSAAASRGVRRVRDLPWFTLGPAAVVVAGVAVLVLLLGQRPDRQPQYVVLPPGPAQTVPGPRMPPPDVCVSTMPVFTDEYYPAVACDGPDARARILGLVVPFEDRTGYPGPAGTAAQARALCRQAHGIASDAEVLVAVPSERAWYADRARYAVCARPVGA